MILNAFDSHAHLDLEQFDLDREEVVARALEAGVRRINTIGIDLAASRKAISLAEKYPAVLASVGIHPQEAHKASRSDILELRKMAAHPRVVALGEMGLDFFHTTAPREEQFQVLGWELELAADLGLPVIIHSRQAQASIAAILLDWAQKHRPPDGGVRGVIHCYSGDLFTAQNYIELGFFISVGAYIGYPSSAAFRETLKSIPLEKLVVETDCPFLPPQKLRGQRNEPAYIPMTLAIVAEVKGLEVAEAARQTTANARRLFNLEQRGLMD